MATQTWASESREFPSWNLALWTAQGALAWSFGVVGVTRAFFPVEYLQQRLNWADGNLLWVRLGGYALIAAALALVLPPLLKLGEKLVPATAAFMGIVMAVTAATHVLKHNPVMLLVDVLFIIGCAVVFWGRAAKAPFVSEPLDESSIQ